MEKNSNYDWSRFVRRIPIKAATKSIYDAWTTRKGIESWFLRKGEFISPDGKILDDAENTKAWNTYEWFWHGWCNDTVERGVILEANGKDYFRFVFGKEGIVTVKIVQEQCETIVELVQEDILMDEIHKAQYHVGCSVGWTFYLANLKSVLEGGLDLRNRNMHLQNVVNS